MITALDAMIELGAALPPRPLADEMRNVPTSLRKALAATGEAGPEHVRHLTTAALFAAMARLCGALPAAQMRARVASLVASLGPLAANEGPSGVATFVLDLLGGRPHGMTDQVAAFTAVGVVCALVDREGDLGALLEPFCRAASRAPLARPQAPRPPAAPHHTRNRRKAERRARRGSK